MTTGRITLAVFWGTAVLVLAAHSDAAKACPTGLFKTTGKWHGCKCPSGSKKDFSGAFKSHARCTGHTAACPSGDFKTTGKWRGCTCPANHHKQWLDPLKYQATCAAGKTKKQQCEDKGETWIGLNHSLGKCIDPPSAEQILQGLDPRVVAYQSYFKAIGSGVNLHPLHERWRTELAPYFDHDLKPIRVGVSKPLGNTAITDCSTIYWPEGTGIVKKLADGTDLTENELRWALHELTHTEQCHEAGSRNGYAYLWFSQLSGPTLAQITSHLSDPAKMSHRNIHDALPMEKDADKKAADLLADSREEL